MMLQTQMDSFEFDQQLGLKHSAKKRSTLFKLPSEDGRIFSNYFTNVITFENGQRVITPMRYRIRPQHSTEEIPSKFNVFNARIDSLEIRQTWRPLFMQKHGIVPFKKFFEWVEDEHQKKKLIAFYPKERELMWAPCLYDEWISKDGRIHFKSFAIITDEPPEEILTMGHDRCPIFLKKDKIEEWLNPQKTNKKNIYQLLSIKEPDIYSHQFVV